jgi:3-isopropylmalate/(R)-2-methylmalate dehydratase large subunit
MLRAPVPDRKQAMKTLYDKLWESHLVRTDEDGTGLLYIDRHYLNEVSSPQAFEALRMNGRWVKVPESTLAVSDHNVPTADRANGIVDPVSRLQVETLDRNCDAHGILQFKMHDARQGIEHVVGPEQGATLPGMTIVCGDSHTSTHGAFAALAFGIGTSEVEHVLATQTLPQRKSRRMLIEVGGALPPGSTAKDLVLSIIGSIGTSGADGYAVEFGGEAIAGLSMEGRMTVCNMAIEAGARVGMVGVDDTTIRYLEGRPLAPRGADWDRCVAYWRTLRSDTGATFDRIHRFDAGSIVPQVTWGTSPEMVTGIHGRVPNPAAISDPARREHVERALAYMALIPDTPIADIRLDKVFIGSCTNSRIEDLRAAAAIVQRIGGTVAGNIRLAMVVPGSGVVKRQGEEEGVDRVFRNAGFEWRESGYSMCVGMNADQLAPGERCASTSNRNFEGRQGAGGRTHLVSPAMAAAAAMKGRFTDIRNL